MTFPTENVREELQPLMGNCKRTIPILFNFYNTVFPLNMAPLSFSGCKMFDWTEVRF